MAAVKRKTASSGDNLQTLGERLREERQRLGFTQEGLAEKVGVSRLTQGKYEKNERKPDADYFERIDATGLDALYIITGHRARPLKIYKTPSDALMSVVEVQDELGLSFSAEQLKAVLGLAYKGQLDHAALKDVVVESFRIANQPLPNKGE